MHGVVMGGGMGISQAARRTGGLRVVTDSTKMAMPETRIGLFPDVGMSWFLARTPGALGRYLAVTGATLDAASALYAGLADAYLPDAALPALLDALRTERLDDGAPSPRASRPKPRGTRRRPRPMGRRSRARARRSIGISRADVAAIAASLDAERDDAVRAAWADKARDAMPRGALSPLSMAVSLEVVERARGATMADCLRPTSI
ncbi:3-hydroxyisobutyryl-CoA hydrolase [Burkholderia mallei]|nr:3-hydroxyisobutyryl-CoA hydrolase [Burkholderia mallei]